jgi:hypothetical protein
MHQSLDALGWASVRAPGDVVLSSNKFYLTPDGKRWFSVTYHNLPRHRSDVLIDELGDMARCGLPGGLWMVRCGRNIPNPTTVRLGAKVGCAGPALLALIDRAMLKEAQSLGYEEKYRGAGRGSVGPRVPCNALSMATVADRGGAHGSGCTQKSAVNIS